MLLLNSWRVSSHILMYETLQLFKNSTDTKGKLRLNLHSLSVSELLEYRRKWSAHPVNRPSHSERFFYRL
jgi:hypothetical protein